MAIELYPHQEKVVAEMRAELRQHRSVLLRAATGFGKTVVAAYMLGNAAKNGKRSIFTVHRQELVDQSAKMLDAMGLSYGIIAAGKAPNLAPLIQIASIDTLKRRIDKIPMPDMAVIDEAHHAGIGGGWSTLIEKFDKAFIIGLTATPRRLDGRGLDHIFKSIVHGPEVSWLIENKFLSPYRAFAPPAPDLSGVHTTMGDYNNAELAEAVDTPKLVGDAVEHYLSICRDARAVVFATNVNHSKHIAAAFRDNGIMALHIDGETPKDERTKAINAFRDNQVKVITNCNLISEGFDLAAMDAAILMRPTQSLALHLQQVGRPLRYAEGKTAILLDHGGNILRHGLPDDEFEWTLEGRKKKSGSGIIKPMRQCPKCYCAHHPAPACPACGFVYPVNDREELAHVEGTLREIDKNSRKAELEARAAEKAASDKAFKRALKKCKTEEDLIAMGYAQGFRNPEAFAAKILATRASWATGV